MSSKDIQILRRSSAEFDEILSDAAMSFIASLAREFSLRVEELLAMRVERQKNIDAGQMPDFLPETAEIRESDWFVTEVPADLRDRRVEITGPTDRKMIINALNSGAKVFMADCEDFCARVLPGYSKSDWHQGRSRHERRMAARADWRAEPQQ